MKNEPDIAKDWPVIITRKIRLVFDVHDKEELRQSFETLFQWQKWVAKAANWIATHYYVQENLKDLFYFTEDMRVKLTDSKKDSLGILKMSRIGTTYQLLSGKLKGQVPMSVIGSLNKRIISSLNKEKSEYAYGNRSLRTYKRNIPIPVVAVDIRNIEPCEKNEYRFTLYGLRFKTNFGRDASNNRLMVEKAISGQYKWCDSSIQIKDNKIFLLAVFRMPKQINALLEKNIVEATLSMEVPIVAKIGEQKTNIGSRDEYLHRRLAIQHALQKTQASSSFNRGGKGRQKKMKAVDRFHEKESNYVNSRLHQYSHRLIDFCLKSEAGTLVLKNQIEREQEARENKFLLRNWAYYGLKEKILYKANKHGIKVVLE